MAATNPWDDPIASSAASVKATPGLIGSTATGTASTYSANTGTADNYSGTGYTAKQTTLNAPTDTVQGQISGLIAANSPLMQKAETKAKQSMNKLGLINSSMAIGAGQAALYDAALPIAQQDASTYSTVNRENTVAKNTELQFGANATNQANSQNAQLNTSTSLANAQSQNQAASQNSQLQTSTSLANADSTNKTAAQNAANTQQTNIANADIESKTNQFNASQSNDMAKLGIDIASKQSLANIEASYKTLMQANQSASEIYKQSVKNITDIMANKDMGQAAKDTAVANQMAMLQKGMEITGAMANLDLGSFLDFSGTPGDGSVSSKPAAYQSAIKSNLYASIPNNNYLPWTGISQGDIQIMAENMSRSEFAQAVQNMRNKAYTDYAAYIKQPTEKANLDAALSGLMGYYDGLRTSGIV